MKKRKIALLTAAGVISVGSIAGCGVVSNEKEKFKVALENLNEKGTGTYVSEISLINEIKGEENLDTFKDVKLTLTSVVDEKNKQNESVLNIKGAVTLEEVVENLDLDISFKIFVDEKESKIYFDVGSVRDGIVSIIEQELKFSPGYLDFSEEEKAFEMAGLVKQIEELLGGTFGVEFKDGQSEVLVMDIEKIKENIKDEKEEEIDAEELKKIILTSLIEAFSDEKFDKGSIKFDVVELIDAILTVINNEEFVKVIGEETLKETGMESNGIKETKESLVELLEDEKITWDFDVDYEIKKERFEKIDLTALFAKEGSTIGIKIKNDIDKEIKFSFKDETKEAMKVDITDKIIEMGLGETVVGLKEAGTFVNTLSGAALVYPFVQSKISNLMYEENSLELMENGLGSFEEEYDFEDSIE